MQYVIIEKSTAGLVLMPSKVDPKVRRWQLPGGEYIKKKDIPQPKMEYEKGKEEWEEYFKQEHDWEEEISTAVAEGRLDPDDARNLGLYLNTSADKIEPLPKIIYHVTTAKSLVMKEGLKTRDQLRQKSGAGLGGGTSNTISFTENQSVAVAIYRGIVEASKVAKGEYKIEQMIKDAKEGKSAKMTFWKMIIDHYYPKGVPKDEEGDPPLGFQLWIKGIERAWRGTVYTPKTVEEFQKEDNIYAHGKKNWKGIPDKNLPEGKFLEFEREMDEHEKREQAMEFYKVFSAYREHAGGSFDPLFFANDVEALAKMKPEDVAILKFEGKGKDWMAGRKGYQMSALGEWRAFSGKKLGEMTDVTGELVKAKGKDKVAIMSLMWATLRGIPRVKEPVEKSLFVVLEKAMRPTGIRPGLVAKKVQVKKMGKPYQAIRWMKPGEEPPKEKSEAKPEEAPKEVPKTEEQQARIRAYHGTIDDFVLSEIHAGLDENAPVDRLIGPHFAQDPEVSNKFAAGLYREGQMQQRQVAAGVSPASVLGWGVSEAREKLPVGGKVFPVALEIKKPREVPQPRYTGKGESGALMTDQVAIACDIARVVFPVRKDLFTTWATKTGGLTRDKVDGVWEALKAGKEITAEEAGSGREAPRKWAEEHGMPYDFGFYTYEYGALFFDNKQELVKEYKRILGEQGYDGLKYQNTSPMETEGVKNINTYVPFSINQVKSVFEKSWDIVDDLLKAFEAEHRTDEEMSNELRKIRHWWKEAKKQKRKESRGGVSFQHYEEIRSDT